MRRMVVTLLIFVLFVSGCSIHEVSDDSLNDIFDTVLYIPNDLSNTFMSGYKFYLPQGVKIVDKSEHNFKLKDSDFYYYLYVDTIAYYYKTSNTYTENDGHFYSSKLKSNNIDGYIDIEEVSDKYFVVLMYNYAKIEAYVPKNNLNKVVMNMSFILASLKYNDAVLSNDLVLDGVSKQEETFNIFNANKENDNFLTYEREYGTYKEKIKQNDTDVIELDDDEI